ncbi:tyrosine-protein kinase domain-containing protein [Winogradskyella sp. SYSU M77433]|uniref:GumC family protein n=1 Tax=Winogradskyella sp. SYSU M77433 TaxID=3042722 RepID=UPI002480A10F|nr:tyrosine-protein kinase domain-containing protein [Winogradskyella sp. SYSU M77433]MDH7911502.1 polysaccharide biosynthesis tyrosine autokinase [Winogradskyella sp. SYSU M77433]
MNVDLKNSHTSKNTDQGEFIKSEIAKYLKYWYWFVLGVLLALATAVLYLRYTPKVYKSSAKIKILNKAKGIELPSSAFVFNRSNINLENEIEILKSYRIVEEVVKKIDLTQRFYEEGNVLTTEIDRLPFGFLKTIENDSIKSVSTYFIKITPNGFEVSKGEEDKNIIFSEFDTTIKANNLPFELSLTKKSKIKELQGKTFIVKLAPVNTVTKGLKNSISVNTVGKTSDLLQLNFNSQSRAKNERILNTLIDIFNQDGIKDRKEVSERTIDFIKERLVLLVEELDSIEIGIKDFKQRNDLITIETDAELGLSQRTMSEQELFDVENQIILSDLLRETLLSSNKETDLLPSNIGLTNSSINGLVSNYNNLVIERDNLAVSAGENNPNVIIINGQLTDLKSNIKTSISSYQKQLEASKQQLLRKNAKYTSQVYSLPAKEKVLLEIMRQQEIKQTLYLFLLQKREEAAINLAITEPSIKVVEYGISNSSPVSPNSKSIYIMALVGGLLIPLSVIYFMLLLDTKVKGREDLMIRNPKIPIVGELPKVKDEHLIFKDPEDNSIQAEAFRILSSNVDYILPNKDKKGRVIYCTSTIKGEGKTYTSINLSLALSSINRRVLLIGADLRNPQIHTHIKEDKHKSGLSNYLHDTNYDWKEALIKGFDKHPNHDIILSGSIPPNPAHLLTNGRFKKLIEEVKQEYDYIIVDTAPTILVTDTLLISQLADATIYLVRANYTEKKLLSYSKDLFDSGKLKNIAYVINSVDTNKSYGYGYNYGYNYGYGRKK